MSARKSINLKPEVETHVKHLAEIYEISENAVINIILKNHMQYANDILLLEPIETDEAPVSANSMKYKHRIARR